MRWGGALAIVVMSLSPATSAADAPADMEPAGAAPGFYRLAQISVEAKGETASGNRWDRRPFAAPDLVVRAWVDGTQVTQCPQKNDVLELTCETQDVFRLEHTSELRLEVVDADLGSDEKVGTATLERVLAAGFVGDKLSMTVDGQLVGAHVKLVAAEQPAAPASAATPADEPKQHHEASQPRKRYAAWVRLIGVGIGVLLALVFGLSFRSALFEAHWFEPPPAPEPEPRCSFCEALIPTGATTCPACGGHRK